ncbi:MAG: Inhibitor of kappaB kinase gamma-like protein [Pedosphaera sp.]|nr:Inhibitor of kappaB kinase gamma-like protein [Pedosphaera sp.]
MSVNRYIQQGQIKTAERRKVLAEVQQLGVSVGRCQETISSVMAELKSANAKYGGERSTRQEVEYLTVLLDCAKKKLAWEKQIASIKKRAPELLERMSKILGDTDHPPADDLKAEMLRSLQIVQGALQSLQAQEFDE